MEGERRDGRPFTAIGRWIPRLVEYVQYRNWILERGIVEPDCDGWWRRYFVALKDVWMECFDAVEDWAPQTKN